MKRYIIKKYIMAESLQKALEQERKIKPEDAWLDEKQPERQELTSQIGFELPASEYYYSPVMKKNAKKRKKTNR
jgi:hypothetical protein